MNIFAKTKSKTGINIKNKSSIIGLLALGIINTAISSATFANDKNPVDEMIKINDHSLHMMSLGEGEFTVIFESGFGNDLSHWRKVAPIISKKAKVVIYSRAGAGLSEPIGKANTLTESTAELSDLIKRAKLKPPFIFVAHSYGSHIVRTYAAQNPNEIAGLVLVDPANEQFMLRLKQLDKIETDNFLQIYEKMVPQKLQAESKVLMAIDEQGALPDFGPLPDVPFAILTSMVQEHPQFIIHSIEGKKLWRELHSNLFKQFNNAQHLVTMNSGHNIATQEPKLVIESINTVIEQASSISRKKQLTRTINTALELISQNQYKTSETLVFDFLVKSKLSSGQINSLGYQYLTMKNNQQKHQILASIVLKYNTINNKQSANTFDSYGESLLTLNKPEKAKLQFIEAIKLTELNGNNNRAIKGFKANLAKAELAIKSSK